MAYAGAPKKVALRLARTAYEIACPADETKLWYIHTHIHTYNTCLYFTSNLQSSSKATEYLREKKRKIQIIK